MYYIIGTYAPLIIDSTAWTLGSAAGNALLQCAIPQLQCDWNENGSSEPLPISKKTYMLAAQIFLVGTCIALYLAAPGLCFSFFATYHYTTTPLHSIALNYFQGLLVASTLRLGDYVIRQSNGHYTPNQMIRKKSIWILSLVTTSILVTGSLCRVPYERILFVQIFVDRATQHLYNFNPDLADRITTHLAETHFLCQLEALDEKKNQAGQQIIKRLKSGGNFIVIRFNRLNNITPMFEFSRGMSTILMKL